MATSVIFEGPLNSSMLCRQCMAELHHAFIERPETEYPFGVNAPKKGYVSYMLDIASCRLCLLLSNHYRRFLTEEDGQQPVLQLSWTHWDAFSWVKVAQDYTAEYSSWEKNLMLGLEVFGSHQTTVRISDNTCDSFGQVHAWLNNCTNDHHDCHDSRVRICPASRLIKIGPLADQGVAGTLQLVETSGIASGNEYATLSHRWSSLDMFKLLKGNLDQMKEALPITHMPKVFQDAVDVARKAGIEYLWIDSLCIIQDSRSDWEIESKKMGDIYLNAILNIAATGFVDSPIGLFAQRDPNLVEPIQLELHDRICQNHQHNRESGKYLLVVRDVWEKGVEHALLNKRGWVVQERFLSPRIIHFGARQLFWECATLEACEAFPNGLPHATTKEHSRKAKKATAFYRAGQSKSMKDDGARLDHWANAVIAYTSSDLTYISDKMIAISGLARKLQDPSTGSYLAGLWHEMLVAQLLWHVKGFTWKPRPSEYRCPSWSPFSTDNPVFQLSAETNDELTYLASVTEAEITPLSDDIFGSVQHGHIKLLCPLTCVEAFDGDKKTYVETPTANGIGVGIRSGLTILVDNSEDHDWIINRPGVSLSVRFREPSSNQEPGQNLLFLASVRNERWASEVGLRNAGCIRGLVLRSAGTKTRAFQRIGTFVTSVDKIIRLIRENVQDLPQAICGERQIDGRYEIRII